MPIIKICDDLLVLPNSQLLIFFNHLLKLDRVKLFNVIFYLNLIARLLNKIHQFFFQLHASRLQVHYGQDDCFLLQRIQFMRTFC